MVNYHNLIRVVLRHAPNCFPNHALLRDVWAQLQAEYNIMSPSWAKDHRNPLDWAVHCSDMVRLMMRHVLEIKRSGTPYLEQTLQALVDSIPTPSSPLPPRLSPMPLPLPSRAPVKKRDSDSSSGAQLCSVTCRCENCWTPPKISIDSSPEQATNIVCKRELGTDLAPQEAKRYRPASPAHSTHSDTSEAARNNSTCVDARRGGQRAATKDSKQTHKQTKGSTATHKRPAGARTHSNAAPAAPSELKLNVVRRHKPPEKKEAYIMLNGKYLLGVTQRVSPNYEQIIESIVSELREGLVSVADAKARVAELL